VYSATRRKQDLTALPTFGLVLLTLRDVAARAKNSKGTHPRMAVAQRLFQRQAPVAQPPERPQRQHMLGATNQRRGRCLVEIRTSQLRLLSR